MIAHNQNLMKMMIWVGSQPHLSRRKNLNHLTLRHSLLGGEKWKLMLREM